MFGVPVFLCKRLEICIFTWGLFKASVWKRSKLLSGGMRKHRMVRAFELFCFICQLMNEWRYSRSHFFHLYSYYSTYKFITIVLYLFMRICSSRMVSCSTPYIKLFCIEARIFMWTIKIIGIPKWFRVLGYIGHINY